MDVKGLSLKYFVLNPTKESPYGEASRKALLAYAKAIESEDLNLSHELRQWEIGCRHNIAEAHIKARAKGAN